MPQHFIRCSSCGLPHPSDEEFCPVHGTPVVPTPSVAPGPRSTRPQGVRSESEWPPDSQYLLDVNDDEPPMSRPSKEAPLVGHLLQGRYRVLDVIAKGGMGMVYEAVHVGLRRPVAIKTLQPKFANNPVAIARFHNEAAVAGRFGHPNIVEVHDMGVLQDGSPYLVMERLQGETVTERLRRERPMPIPIAVEITRQVLCALIVTHAEGILHRDLKPNNLCLVSGKRHLTVKVLDFGVASAVGPYNSVLASVDGGVAGTPAFMAPEQALGSRDLDARADLYSLGMILYVMLTGRLPYKARTPAALLLEMQLVSPMRPRLLRPEVSPALDGLTMCALARDREQRFPDAKTMLEALEQLSEQDLQAMPPPSTPGEDDDEAHSQRVEYFVRQSILPPASHE